MTFSFDGELITVPDKPHERIHSNPVVSVVLTAYRRPEQLRETLRSIMRQDATHCSVRTLVVEDGYDGGATERVAAEFQAWYVCRKNRPSRPHSNTSIPWNIGIQAARLSDIIVFQCAECKYEDATGLAQLLAPVIVDSAVSTCASVLAMNQDGTPHMWYQSPVTHPHCFLPFCQAVATRHVLALGGFDENYVDYGLEDNDFEFRLQFSGVECRYVPVRVTHQWHETHEHSPSDQYNSTIYYQQKLIDLKGGKPRLVANEGRKWGRMDS